MHTNFRRLALMAALIFPLGILFLAKYLSFAWLDIPGLFGIETSLDSLPNFIRLGFPAGISFYTFQVLSYDIDVRDGHLLPERDLLSFATYISFFPQLIAGPILRFDQISDQFKKIKEGLPPDTPRGLKYFSIGLFAKILGADLIAAFTKPLHATLDAGSSIHPLDGLFYVLGYSFRIYYDFWSYSIMAMGLALLFGLVLPINFNEPYLSRSPREFWRRWHITLSYWIRDYIYLKLGGNKSYVRNILIVFIVCGVWHGAGFGFILWGIYHGILVLAHHFTRSWWDQLPRTIAIALTFILVTLGWPLFDLGVGGYVNLAAKLDPTAQMVSPGWHFGFLGLIALLTFAGREQHWLYNHEKRAIFDWPVVHAGLLFTALLFLDYGQTFIYFRF
ncbi:MAG: hypothetical protein KKB70_04645 [Proteobacteria bacterium]|nr:hypothetical protein [Pseudomonadota bacterium]MBU1612700.1 hypothetical protein [Pseudomonadota bacterium]